VTDKIVVLVTAGNLREGRKIARRLVETRLAACVNVLSALESIYRWEGKIEKQSEVLLVAKTTRALFVPLRHEVLKLHSYTNPEIICLPILDAAPDYLQWLAESVRTTPEAG
jgi:periplasmic divalent cation tolerance protein